MRYSMKIQNKTITEQELNEMEDEIIFYDPTIWLMYMLCFWCFIVIVEKGVVGTKCGFSRWGHNIWTILKFSNCCRPYYAESTGSHLNSEVKRHQARLVLRWGTAWEVRVTTALFYFFTPNTSPGSALPRRVDLEGFDSNDYDLLYGDDSDSIFIFIDDMKLGGGGNSLRVFKNRSNCCRPYYAESTGSHLNSEVKRHQARLVLRWGTAWEVRVATALFYFFASKSENLWV